MHIILSVRVNLWYVSLFNVLSPRTPIPVIVTEFNRDNDDEGLPEKTLLKNATYFE